GDGDSADRGHYGYVRGGRRISAGDVRSRADDGRQRLVSGWARAGAGRDRAEVFRGRTGRRGDARGNQRDGGLSRTERRGLRGAHSGDRREVGISAAVAVGSAKAGRTRARGRGNLWHLRFFPGAALRHEGSAGSRGGRGTL